MVPDNAEHSLVVVGRFLRVEFNDDSRRRVGWNGSFSLRKGKDIGAVAEELVSGGLVAVVYNVQKTVCGRFELNLTKMDALVGQIYIVSKRLTLACELELVSSVNIDGILSAAEGSRNGWSECN